MLVIFYDVALVFFGRNLKPFYHRKLVTHTGTVNTTGAIRTICDDVSAGVIRPLACS